MANITSKAKALAALAVTLTAAAFGTTQDAAALARPTTGMMNKCAIDGTIEQVGSSHIKCCMPKYCIWCNTTTNKCWVKGTRARITGSGDASRPILKRAR